jgi:predicted XRE-type DNA-binding protein
MTQQETTQKVKELVDSNLYTQKDIGEKIGVTEPTISRRIKLSNWKQKEINVIKKL